MKTRGRFLALVTAVTALITLVCPGLILWFLYIADFEAERSRLTELARNQVQLTSALLRYDGKTFSPDSPDDHLEPLIRAYRNTAEFGRTGQYTLARLQGDKIHFLLAEPTPRLSETPVVPIGDPNAEPMLRALTGETGSYVGPDLRGKKVLAAYAPITGTGLGIVVKIDVTEVRAPFVLAAEIGFFIALVLISITTITAYAHHSRLMLRVDESERRYQDVLTTTTQGYLSLRRNGLVREVNEAICEMLGYRADELIGKNLVDLGMAESRSVFEAQRELQDHQDRRSYEVILQHGDGHGVHCLINATNQRNESDEITGVIMLITDVTENKLAQTVNMEGEAYLRTLLDVSPVGFAISSARDGRLMFFNTRWAEMIEVPPEELLGRPATEFYADPSKRNEMVDAVWRQGQIHDVEVEYRSAKGRRFWSLVTMQATLFNGEPAVFGWIYDISELKQAMAEQQAAKERAQLADRTKTEFLANMSHELRTPLNSIIGFSSIMSEEIYGPINDPKYAEYIEDIKGSGEHLLQLINDILDVSRIEAEALSLDERTFDPQETALSCLRWIAERAHKSGLKATADFDDNLPLLHADERRIKQILINLLTNAVKFTPAGGHVRLAVKSTNDGLSFVVSDTGIGMAPEDIPAALRPFSQIDGGLARRHDGVGLGLYLTSRLVRLHDGTMEIESTEGAGTKITLTFPPRRSISRQARAVAG